MFFSVIALATLGYINLASFEKSTSKNIQPLTLENRISDPRKSCFGPPRFLFCGDLMLAAQ